MQVLNVSLVLVMGVAAGVFVWKKAVRFWHALVIFLFGFYSYASQAGPSISHMLESLLSMFHNVNA